MSQKEYAEDTVFWSLKASTQFAARRRTVSLYLANSSGSPSHVWIDNTPQVWSSLLSVLEAEQPESIAINADSQIAFSSGLHAGELENVLVNLGPSWSERLVNKPMLAVEFVGTMPKGQLGWYKKLMETAWAMIGEGFSEGVIEPGKTTTEVCDSPTFLCFGTLFRTLLTLKGCGMVVEREDPRTKLYDMVPMRCQYCGTGRSLRTHP